MISAALADRVAEAARSARPRTRGRQALRRAAADDRAGVLRGEPFERAAAKGACRSPALLEDQPTIPAIAQQLALIAGRADRRVVGRRQLPDARRGRGRSCGCSCRSSSGRRRTSSTRTSRTRSARGPTSSCPDRRRRRQHRVPPVPQEGRALPQGAPGRGSRRQGPLGRPLTAEDIAELQRILVAAGIGDERHVRARRSRRPGASASSSAHWSGSTERPPRRRSRTSSTTSATARTRSSSSTSIIDELTDRGVVEARPRLRVSVRRHRTRGPRGDLRRGRPRQDLRDPQADHDDSRDRSIAGTTPRIHGVAQP